MILILIGRQIVAHAAGGKRTLAGPPRMGKGAMAEMTATAAVSVLEEVVTIEEIFDEVRRRVAPQRARAFHPRFRCSASPAAAPPAIAPAHLTCHPNCSGSAQVARPEIDISQTKPHGESRYTGHPLRTPDISRPTRNVVESVWMAFGLFVTQQLQQVRAGQSLRLAPARRRSLRTNPRALTP